MTKVIYITDTDYELDINGGESYVIYHYLIDKGCNIKINLNGENASLKYYLSIISINDNISHISVNHNASNTTSDIYNHGVNVSNKKLVFDVTGYVPKDCKNCTLNQDNTIINLNDGFSQINPNLLIDNFDTISNHSAYIGKLKEEKLFYLMSRGINLKRSRSLLISSLLTNGDKNKKVVKKFIKELGEITNG